MYQNTPVAHVVAVDLDGNIGKNNTIPWRSKADLKHFKELTVNKVCIMGRNTFQSLPKPLKDRTVIVVTNQTQSEVAEYIRTLENHQVAPSIGDALKVAAGLSMGREIMICGGAQIYHQTLPWVDRIYMSVIETVVEDADTKYDVPFTSRVPEPEIVLFHFNTDNDVTT